MVTISLTTDWGTSGFYTGLFKAKLVQKLPGAQIVDISHEKLDKTFQYLIPEQLNDMVQPGVEVDILFGITK